MQKLFYPIVVTMCLMASNAAAGELKLSMANGRVTLIAQDVPVRQILTEWARIGNTKIVNAEKVAGPTVTLHLIDRPEREVLDAVLRHVAGYVAAPRPAGGEGGAIYDRILILATSQAPAYTPVASAPTFTRPQTPVPVPDDDPVDPNMVPPPGAQLPPGVRVPGMPPQPGMVPGPQTAPVPGMMGTQPGPQNQPLTAPRPGMLPPPQPTPVNPYAPPQPTRPGGRGGGPGGQ